MISPCLFLSQYVHVSMAICFHLKSECKFTGTLFTASPTNIDRPRRRLTLLRREPVKNRRSLGGGRTERTQSAPRDAKKPEDNRVDAGDSQLQKSGRFPLINVPTSAITGSGGPPGCGRRRRNCLRCA